MSLFSSLSRAIYTTQLMSKETRLFIVYIYIYTGEYVWNVICTLTFIKRDIGELVICCYGITQPPPLPCCARPWVKSCVIDGPRKVRYPRRSSVAYGIRGRVIYSSAPPTHPMWFCSFLAVRSSSSLPSLLLSSPAQPSLSFRSSPPHKYVGCVPKPMHATVGVCIHRYRILYTTPYIMR